MATANSLLNVDVAEIIAARRVGRFHFEIVALCALAMLVDGYDTQAAGFTASSIARAFALKPAELEPVFAAGGLGSLLGMLVLAPLADRVGRKRVIIGSMLLFGASSFATAFADSLTQLIAIRFVTGLGLGGVVPAALALAAEFMPRRHKITMTMIAWCGFSLGSAAAGPVTASIVQADRWSAVFLLGGLLPLITVPILWTALPESLLMLTRRGDRETSLIRATLMRISRRYDFLRVTQFFSSERHDRGFPVLLLFRDGRAPITALLWIMFFMSLLAVFILTSWMPAVLHNSGLSQDRAFLVSGLASLGGIAGGFVVAPLADRLNRHMILAAGFLLSAMLIATIAVAGTATPLVAAIALLAGGLAVGTQNAANAVVAASTPTTLRATGIGWALGMGRMGQIAAPLVAGTLLALHWRSNHVLAFVALPSLVAAAASLLIGLSRRRFGDEPDAVANPARSRVARDRDGALSKEGKQAR